MNNKWEKKRCSKKSFWKDFGLPSTKNSTWEPNLEWRVLLLLWPNCFWKSAVCQLCANTHSMFRVPDLFWLTGAVFRNISVTHSKFSKRKKKFKNVGFWPRASKRQLFGYPRRFPKGHSKFQSVDIYIYTIPQTCRSTHPVGAIAVQCLVVMIMELVSLDMSEECRGYVSPLHCFNACALNYFISVVLTKFLPGSCKPSLQPILGLFVSLRWVSIWAKTNISRVSR